MMVLVTFCRIANLATLFSLHQASYSLINFAQRESPLAVLNRVNGNDFSWSFVAKTGETKGFFLSSFLWQ
ncbi:MAG TPA: hypothetical protein DCD97_04975 [Firmicutes bacterium]|nr:hypothetical protein [Bacillota bacterium]